MLSAHSVDCRGGPALPCSDLSHRPPTTRADVCDACPQLVEAMPTLPEFQGAPAKGQLPPLEFERVSSPQKRGCLQTSNGTG